ncbi:MAG: glycoside hydrolase family 3 N-terminal domain-containing protein [Actinomycetota bacterium]
MSPDRRAHTLGAALLAVIALTAACSSSSGSDEAIAADVTVVPTTAVEATTSTTSTTTTTTTTTTTVPTTTTTTSPSACFDEAPMEVRVAQLVVALVPHERLPEAAELVAAGRLGGVVVMGEPTDVERLRTDLTDLRERSPFASPFVMVDEEGGRVQRLRQVLGPIPAAAEMAATLTTDEVVELAIEHGTAMAELGITVVLAPVVDVGGGPAIGDRSFSDDPDEVIRFGSALLSGYRSVGLVATAKHFPGHGRASGDTHLVVAQTPPLDDLVGRDLLPFAALPGGPLVAVMMSHLVVPGMTAEGTPASLDAGAYDYLRTTIGFDGLVMTDALDMAGAGVGGPEPIRATAAVIAGADTVMVALPAVEDTVAELGAAHAAGTLTDGRLDASLDRVASARGACG